MTLFFRQWRGELLKLFARRRTFIGFGAFLLFEVVLYVRIKLWGSSWLQRQVTAQGQLFEKFDSALTLALFLVLAAVLILGALYICLISGDMVAKENEDGHYRLLLARPVSRLRLLFVKYLTCVSYSLVLVQFIAWSAFVLSVVVKGWGGGFFAMVPDIGLMEFYDWGPGLARYALATLFLSLGMVTISSIAFFCSCLPIKPAAATISALSYALIDLILQKSNVMENFEHLLLTTHMGTWARTLTMEVPWPIIIRSFTILGAVNLSAFILGVAIFQSRDLKS